MLYIALPSQPISRFREGKISSDAVGFDHQISLVDVVCAQYCCTVLVLIKREPEARGRNKRRVRGSKKNVSGSLFGSGRFETAPV